MNTFRADCHHIYNLLLNIRVRDAFMGKSIIGLPSTQVPPGYQANWGVDLDSYGCMVDTFPDFRLLFNPFTEGEGIQIFLSFSFLFFSSLSLFSLPFFFLSFFPFSSFLPFLCANLRGARAPSAPPLYPRLSVARTFPGGRLAHP